MSETNDGAKSPPQAAINVTLEALPERRLIPHAASVRRIDYRIQVSAGAKRDQRERSPLTLALVIDRSGSMSGDKLQTAKRAALAVLDQLDERDTVSVVVYDDQIDTIQSAKPVSPAIKKAVAMALAGIHSRGSTALHEGWLTGCNSIVGQEAATQGGLARCFLLTDGLANAGLTDPERIAAQAGGVRRNAGVGTSTFGIGADYAEELLGPMAEAGGGQFHNLRTSAEIASAFAGELGELLLAAAMNVRLEIEVESGASVEMLSVYHAQQDAANQHRWSVMIGDLMGAEERHVLASLNFPISARHESQTVRARALWVVDGVEQATEWQPLTFTYATDAECEAEVPDPVSAQRIGEAISDRAQREAIARSKRGDYAGARGVLGDALNTARTYAPSAPALASEMAEMEAMERQMGEARPLDAGFSKERYFQKQRRSTGHRDLRGEANKEGDEQ